MARELAVDLLAELPALNDDVAKRVDGVDATTSSSSLFPLWSPTASGPRPRPRVPTRATPPARRRGPTGASRRPGSCLRGCRCVRVDGVAADAMFTRERPTRLPQVHATPSSRDSHADNAPEPVSATASTSQPHSAAGTVNAWTAVGRSRPARAAPFNNQLALGAENIAAKDGAGLTDPPVGAVAEPATDPSP